MQHCRFVEFSLRVPMQLFVGTIPVVVGTPNIKEFAPSPDSYLHIKEISDVESVAKSMKYLAENPKMYNQSLRYSEQRR